MMKKKGLMKEFLFTTILAFMIFIPTCMFASEMLRVSDQAKANFPDFVTDLQDTYTSSRINDKTQSLLIMDEGTALVYLYPDEEELIVSVDAKFPLTDYSIHFERSEHCPIDKSCICLLSNPVFDVDFGVPGYDKVIVTADYMTQCKVLDYYVFIESCNIGTPERVHSYTCEGGFMIERNLAKESSWLVGAYFDNPRRNSVTLERTNTGIKIEP
tara:strand:- start:114 stop:755 length:642 start_codon:yes stop_codon:yes gene_type:complete